MIKNKGDLKRHLEMDRIALGKTEKRPRITDLVWRFEIALRKHEYYTNCTRNRIMQKYYRFKHACLGLILGFEIPINTFGGVLESTIMD